MVGIYSKRQLQNIRRVMPTTMASASWGSIKGRSMGAGSLAPLTGYSSPDKSPFGPMMAGEIFDLYDEDYEDPLIEESDDQLAKYTELFDEGNAYQESFELENIRDLEDRLRQQIRKFEIGYGKMMGNALKWHYLMEECEENHQVRKMFMDVQMMRKLNGSDTV